MREGMRALNGTVGFYKEHPQKITQREATTMGVIKNVGKLIIAAAGVYLTKEAVTDGLGGFEVAGGIVAGYIGWLSAVFGFERQRAVQSLLPKL